jgi:hypothetical protein
MVVPASHNVVASFVLPQQLGQESGKSRLMRCRIRPTDNQPLEIFGSGGQFATEADGW